MIFLNTLRKFCASGLILSGCFFLPFPQQLQAAEILDYIREYDLNDFALGLGYSVSESPYQNAENSISPYPYLTSLRHPSFTDDWVVISDGNIGFRWVNDSGLVLGAVGRVETLGIGSNRPVELIGLDDRKWSWELAPMVGWRAWPVHFNFRAYKEVFGRHGGLTSELAMSLPFEWPRGYLVPSIEYVNHDNSFMDYYYEVSATEANTSRPAYDPDSAGNLAAKLAWGYRLTDLWLLSGRAGIEWLPDEIINSPIVDKDSLWSFSVGLAYNADIFQKPLESTANTLEKPRLELRLGIFRDNAETSVIRNNSNGSGGEVIKVDDILGASATETLAQTDILLRLGRYHRLQLGHFQLARNSQAELSTDLTLGDTLFPAGSRTKTTTDSSVTRLSYGYSLVNDAQKEVGVLAGLHAGKIEASVASLDTGEAVSIKADSPLPVIGAYGSVHLTDRLSLGIQGEFFRMDFDSYDGSVTMINLSGQYQLINNLALGLGYNYYKLKINSDDVQINGQIQGKHTGPYMSLGLRF